MGLGKTGYYTVKDIKKKKAQYNIILGERSPGKSYAVKAEALRNAWKAKAPTMVIIRRFEEDIKTAYMQQYFGDNNENTGADGDPFEITGGEFDSIYVMNCKIYFANRDPDSGKYSPGLLIGYCMALSNDERYKSQQFPEVTDVIFEEFVTRKLYLRDEPVRLMNLISTIARKREITVWMIANTISRVCPYFLEWSLRNIPLMQPGTIDTYTFGDTKIAVEMAPTLQKKSRMFFGQAAKSIQGGQWEAEELPALPEDYSEYDKLYEMYVEGQGFTFKLELLINSDAEKVIYVYPFTKQVKPALPCITEEFTTDPQKRPYLNKEIPAEQMISRLYMQGKICFSSNLCGADFGAVLKNMKGGLTSR